MVNEVLLLSDCCQMLVMMYRSLHSTLFKDGSQLKCECYGQKHCGDLLIQSFC